MKTCRLGVETQTYRIGQPIVMATVTRIVHFRQSRDHFNITLARPRPDTHGIFTTVIKAYLFIDTKVWKTKELQKKTNKEIYTSKRAPNGS